MELASLSGWRHGNSLNCAHWHTPEVPLASVKHGMHPGGRAFHVHKIGRKCIGDNKMLVMGQQSYE